MQASSLQQSRLDLDADEAVYLYGIASRQAEGFVHEGLNDGRAVQAHAVGSLVAVVDTVSVKEWTGAKGEEHLQSLAWVGPRAVHHEQVVEAVMTVAPVYPASFGTLFSTMGQLEVVMEAHRSILDAFLDRVEQAEEWAIKGLLDRERAEAYLSSQSGKETTASPGMAYLQRRQRQQQASAEVGPWLETVGATLMAQIKNIARDMAPRAPRSSLQDPRDVVLNWALLTERNRIDDMQACIEAFNTAHESQGLELKITGPWPPYTFRPSLTGAEE